jgi:hypothetical protein
MSHQLKALMILLVAMGPGCNRSPGAPARFAEVSLDPPRRMQPAVCKAENNGKRYQVEGYLHWPDGLLGSTDSTGSSSFLLDLFAENDRAGHGRGLRVPMRIKGRRFFGLIGDVDEPKVYGAKERSVIGGREVEGEVDEDEMRVHLHGGGTANGRTKVRVTLRLMYLAGGCGFDFVQAERA